MTYTQEQLDAIQAETQLRHNARNELETALRQVLDSSEYNLLSNYCKAEVLLDLENDGEYDPLG